MKKTVATKKPTKKTSVKSRATTKSVKSRAATKKVAAKSTVSSRAKKTAAPKGVRRVHHHAKKLYHATPRFIHGMIAGALVGFLVVTALSASAVFDPASSSAATKCDAHGIGKNHLTEGPNNTAYKVSGSKVTVTFNVVGNNCNLPVTMVVWKAPNGTTGRPYSVQTLYFHTVKTFKKAGRYTITGNLPSCYYQVDTVTGTKLTGKTDGAHAYGNRQVAYMHGGNKKCTTPAPKPPTPPTPSQATACNTTTMKEENVPTGKANTPPYTTDLSKCDIPPEVMAVCDLISHEIVQIEKEDYDSSLHGDANACTPTPEVPETPDTPEELPDTGPGAVITIAVLSVIGGVVYHKLHHRHKAKKHAR